MLKTTAFCLMLCMSASSAYSIQSNDISSSPSKDLNLNEKILQARELSNPQSKKFDIQKAVSLYLQESDRNNPTAQYELAKLYDDGELVQMDIERAIKFYQLSSEQNHSDALYNLALKYRDGDGVPRDKKRFILLIKKSANAGNPLGQLYLARLLRNDVTGDNLYDREARAAIYYILSARKNIPAAQLELGELYGTGEGVPIDLNKQLKQYQLAAQALYPKAFFVLGMTYLNGINGFLQPNKENAITTFEHGAILAEPKCQFLLGWLYSNMTKGKERSHDLSRGYPWIKLASLNGNKKATEAIQQINKGSPNKLIDQLELETQALIKKHPEYLRN